MHHTNDADHARHDLTLIAGHAAGDLSDTHRVHADALLASCSPCADLRRDLVAIAAATRSLPAPAMPPRDFRIDPAQAERLRRGSWLRAALRPFAASGSAVRPMAAAFTSLGVAGLFVALVLPGMFLAGSPAAGGPGMAAEVARESAAAAARPGSTQRALGQAAPDPTTIRVVGNGASQDPGDMVVDGDSNYSATSAPQAAAGGAETATPDEDEALGLRTTAAPAVNPLIAGSLGLLIVGLLLFGLRSASRRLR